MAEEIKGKEARWEPQTPAKQQQQEDTGRGRVAKRTKKTESNNGEMPGDLEMKTKDDIGASNRKPRQKMKRHRPQVVNEKKSVKPSTPELKTPKPPKQVRKKVDKKAKRSCKRKLEFTEESSTVDQKDLKPCNAKDNISEEKLQSSSRLTTLSIYVIKKKRRKMRTRLSLEKLIRLVGMINDKSSDCVSTILNIGWTNLKRRRSRTTHTRRHDLSGFLPKGSQVVDSYKPAEQCQHPQHNVVGSTTDKSVEHFQHLHDGAESGDCTLGADKDISQQNLEFDTSFQLQEDIPFKCMNFSDEPMDILHCQDAAVQEALADFAAQKMKSLCIDEDKNKQLVVDPKHLLPRSQKPNEETSKQLVVDSKCNQLVVDTKRKNRKIWRPEIDIDEGAARVSNLFRLGIEDTEEKDKDKKDDRKTYLEEERERFAERVNLFIYKMFRFTGDRRFTRWKGSVVDSVVGVFLTQNTGDHLSSNAFMILAARYPAPSLREQNSGGDAIEYVVHEHLSPKCEESNPNTEVEIDVLSITTKAVPVEIDVPSSTAKAVSVEIDAASSTTKAKSGSKNKKKNGENAEENWDNLRIQYADSSLRMRGDHNADIVDWKAVRETPFDELAKLILERGMNNDLAAKIKGFLDRLVKDHGCIDLEWLRNVPPLKAKSYLMSFYGLALKSGECIRLLSLYQPAFPIDVNLARVLVRIGWVKLQRLPEGVKLHQLNSYPDMAKVHAYIWPRICQLDAQTLYELHCYMNVFSKAFCTMRKPKCSQCPMRDECLHYASALASSDLHLEGPHAKNTTSESSTVVNRKMMIECADDGDHARKDHCKPIIEFPASPGPASTESLRGDMDDFSISESLGDIEDFDCESKFQTNEMSELDYDNETESLRGDIDDFISSETLGGIDDSGCESTFQNIVLNNTYMSELDYDNDDISNVAYALTQQVRQHFTPKIKHVKRIRTEHQVYVLPDSHPLVARLERRDPQDPCPYLLAIWPGDLCQEPNNEGVSTQESTTSCSSEIVPHRENDTIKATLLIPSRTANRGQFPLNGTYFQFNEVFAHHGSSQEPVDVPREWIWNLPKRTLYCGSSIAAICRDMSLQEIEQLFHQGNICIRGFSLKTRRPTMLHDRFHIRTTKKDEEKVVVEDDIINFFG